MPVTDRLSRIGYQKARLLLLVAGLGVLAVVAAVMLARGVDSVEVGATLLFIPVFLGFVYRGVAGGLVMGVLASIGYALLRLPAIEAVGGGDFAGLIASRSVAYLVFGLVGGWSNQTLESSLEKLDLYDQIDDETSLFNARFLIQQTDLEKARATRYKTLFSVVLLEFPSAALTSMARRKRAGVLRELGRQLTESVRTVDRVAHAHDGTRHRLAVVLPETGQEGAEIFRSRFQDRVAEFLTTRGAIVEGGLVSSTITFPGDEHRLDALRNDFGRIDALEHATPL
jgi:GGDEF domain-containing protein